MTDRIYKQQQNSTLPVIHRGKWLIAGGLATGAKGFKQTVLENGALLTAEGLIRAAGKFQEIKKEYGQYQVRDCGERVLTPGLINAHCHLELSHLDLADKNKRTANYRGIITDWIRDLLKAKEIFYRENKVAENIIRQQGRLALQQMHDNGVAFVGDIGNSLASSTIGEKHDCRVHFLLELLGLSKESESKSLARLEHIKSDNASALGCTPHAPYSTTPVVIQTIKKQADRTGQVLSIHVAESGQEVEFLASNGGNFREFLVERGVWDGSFSIPGKSPVQYLESLGVIDSRTICVHGVHVNPREIAIMAEKKAKICLCPGSNRFLGVGRAPVTEYLGHGILPALGTDSKASNRMLNMWREMRLLREDHPDLPPESVFAMATLGGAEAWGISAELGALAPGKKSLILAVSVNARIKSPADIFEFLTTNDGSQQVQWLQ